MELLDYESPQQQRPPDWSWIVHVLLAILVGVSLILGVIMVILWAIGWWQNA